MCKKPAINYQYLLLTTHIIWLQLPYSYRVNFEVRNWSHTKKNFFGLAKFRGLNFEQIHENLKNLILWKFLVIHQNFVLHSLRHTINVEFVKIKKLTLTATECDLHRILLWPHEVRGFLITWKPCINPLKSR